MHLRRVSGRSMYPFLNDGDVVVAWPSSLRPGQIVLARQGGREIIKRIERLEAGQVYLVGDNAPESQDSRHYGKIATSAILGVVMIVLPKAVNPPKLVKPYGVWLGRVAALLLTAASLVHLYRIDTFIPLLDDVLPGDAGFASSVAMLIILTEMFAIPFALRMKLSPLGHFVSGTLMILAPFWWVLVGIWTLGVSDTAQLGEFIAAPSTVMLLVLNICLVLYAYLTLYTLGYGSLKLGHLLRK